jgi:hypothetical protein
MEREDGSRMLEAELKKARKKMVKVKRMETVRLTHLKPRLKILKTYLVLEITRITLPHYHSSIRLRTCLEGSAQVVD